MNPTIHVWITHNALTQGIQECNAEHCLDNSADMIEVKQAVTYPIYYHGEGRNWHRTRESAVKRAEEMRQRKIISLQKQIDKLLRINFT